MKFIIVGRNIEVTPGLKAAVEDKLSKLSKYFNPDTEVHVTLSVEKDRQKIEVTIPVKGSIIRSEQASSDMYVSIDRVVDLLERQIRKNKTKLERRYHDNESFKFDAFVDEFDDDEDYERNIRRKS